MTGPVLRRSADLLQGRRRELGLPVATPRIRSAWQLLRPGVVVGFVVVTASLVMQWSLQMHERNLQQTLNQLAPVEQQIKSARATLQKTKKRAATLQQDTAQITSRLVSVRSGSAFLEQLKRTTPAAVSLQSVTVLPSQINISGTAQGGQLFGGWQQINGFALNLESLAAVPQEGAQVQQARAEEGGGIGFKLRVTVDASVQSTPDQLRDLGADGLVLRYELLKEQGLPL